MVQKLNDAGVPPYKIIQVTEHKNVISLNNYSSVNETQQRDISKNPQPMCSEFVNALLCSCTYFFGFKHVSQDTSLKAM